MATLPTSPDLTPEELFHGHLKLIEEVIAHACRQSGFSGEDAKDFAQQARLKLVENKFAVLREYRGRSSLKTYLTTVIWNVLRDYRNHIWKKWRPCAQAERLGPVAVKLDRLLSRDGLSFEDACRVLRDQEKVEMSVEELAELRDKIPQRHIRQMYGAERLETEPSKDLGPAELLEKKQRALKGQRIFALLKGELDKLPSEDKVLIEMRSEFSVAEIARFRRVEQKPLYRRLDKIYKELRKGLERHGVRRQDIDEILGELDPDPDSDP